MEFKDVSSEKQRTYVFPGGHEVKIIEPIQLNVSASGGHRVLDAANIAHYIPAGWVHLFWTVKEGKSAFEF